ncbi:hypothetical protein SORBI_3002G099300, partial [Sorghum bicolor]
GIWIGMLTGTFLQMSILLAIIFTTKWDKQAALAEVRMAEWGGKNENLPLMETTHTADFSADTNDHCLTLYFGCGIVKVSYLYVIYNFCFYHYSIQGCLEI